MPAPGFEARAPASLPNSRDPNAALPPDAGRSRHAAAAEPLCGRLPDLRALNGDARPQSTFSALLRLRRAAPRLRPPAAHRIAQPSDLFQVRALRACAHRRGIGPPAGGRLPANPVVSILAEFPHVERLSSPSDASGYATCSLVVMTFCTKRLVPLRIVAMAFVTDRPLLHLMPFPSCDSC